MSNPSGAMTLTVLVTGGAGFIGSHTCVELLTQGHHVVVVDDHSNSSPAALQRVEQVSGKRLTAVYETDMRDEARVHRVFAEHRIDAVVHFAAKKAVGESVRLPLAYYDVNVVSTAVLLRAMLRNKVHRLVFSSSCSIYGETGANELTEASPPAPTNPYARTKWVCEQMVSDVCGVEPDFRAISLRYFNPAGAHPSGKLGEDPRGIPNNILPYLARLAVGRRAGIEVFGSDYRTPDGTPVRDYVHVVDVADGHRLAIEHLDDRPGVRVFNLGTGVGTSVLELITAFSSACGRRLPYTIVGRRPGDVARLVASADRARRDWGWSASRDVAAICRDAWRFQRKHPEGYATDAGASG